jgi:anaerobic ribonucleoside-triphosphate reductase activating protein
MEIKRYVTITSSISQDGLGVPVVSIYFSYCDKKDITGSFCLNCHNLELQKDGVGYLLSIKELLEIIKTKYKFLYEIYGKCEVALIGGEPLAEINRYFSEEIAKKYPTIIYTWRTLEDFKKENIDISVYKRIVCGEYIEELKAEDDYTLGSKNQYIVNSQGNIILKYEKEGDNYEFMD